MLFISQEAEVSSEKEMVFRFAGRPHGDLEKSRQLIVSRSAATFGDIRRDGSSGATDLASQALEFLFRFCPEEIRKHWCIARSFAPC